MAMCSTSVSASPWLSPKESYDFKGNSISYCIYILTVAWELSWTLHGSTATPPRWAIMLVLFLVVNIDRVPNELSTALELVSGNGTVETIKFVAEQK